MGKMPTDELVSKIIGRGIPIIAVVVMLWLGFFDKTSSVYADMHPFTFWDGLGLALFLPVAAFAAGFIKVEGEKIRWYHFAGALIVALIGVLMIIGVNG